MILFYSVVVNPSHETTGANIGEPVVTLNEGIIAEEKSFDIGKTIVFIIIVLLVGTLVSDLNQCESM